MGVYTTGDFTKAAQKNGFSNGKGFSTADWNLAMQNPDAGMSLLNAKLAYASATTPEGRAKAHQDGEQIRSHYGHYSGGSDGTSFYLDKPSPGSFQPAQEKPEFSYNLETDPVYSAYRKQYAREGQRAAQDALGTVASATGGIPSSYAATAVSQAGDYYASQLADKVPELYQQAYNRYLNDLSQWNTDRNFLYGQHLDEINAKTADRQETLQNALYGAQIGDYSGLQKLGYDVSSTPEQFEKELQIASLGASVGDYSPLKKYFGVNADKSLSDADMMYKLAVAQANAGNYGYLNRLTGKYF